MRFAAVFAMFLLLITAVTAQAQSPVGSQCDPNYADACVRVTKADLNCSDVNAEVSVVGTDVHGLDDDNDGIGCEGYPRPPTSNGRSTPSGAGRAGASANGGDRPCSTIFVAGKGIIDSCTGERRPTARVFPRKPGVPPEGCIRNCPQPEAPPVPPAPRAPVEPPPPAGPRPTPPPIERDFTAPAEPEPSAPPPTEDCDRVSYPDVCIALAPPYLTCSDIDQRNFRVRAPDPHRFDADGNGIGCEEVSGPSIGR